MGGIAEHLRRHRLTFGEFGGDEDAAGDQAEGGDRQRQRGRQEAVHQGDGEREHGLIAAAVAANLQQQRQATSAVVAAVADRPPPPLHSWYLQGPLGQFFPPARVLLDQGDVEQRRRVALLHVQQPLDDTAARHAGVPPGPELRRAWGLRLLLVHLLTPQRRRHAC